MYENEEICELCQEDKNKLYLKYGLKCLLHNLDLLSDFLYICTVPTYNAALKYLLIIFILYPLLILLGYRYN